MCVCVRVPVCARARVYVGVECGHMCMGVVMSVDTCQVLNSSAIPLQARAQEEGGAAQGI